VGGRPQERTWGDSALARAVTALDGPRVAAAYVGMTHEGMIQALQRGYIADGRKAVKLVRAAARRGHAVTIEAIVGVHDAA